MIPLVRGIPGDPGANAPSSLKAFDDGAMFPVRGEALPSILDFLSSLTVVNGVVYVGYSDGYLSTIGGS
jgi:hypothetical protein